MESGVIIIGAGASGLAVAAVLQRQGQRAIVLDADDRIGGTWIRRYDRLCHHTPKQLSGLPYLPLPRDYPRYVPKDLSATYLEAYADRSHLDVRLGTKVERISRRDDGRWSIATSTGMWTSAAVIIATGRYRLPHMPQRPGLNQFRGRVLHATSYRNGREFAGLRALEVGIGNSGAEIAVDLVDHGAASVSISVRTTPPISSRSVFGLPVQVLGIVLAPLPPRPLDWLGARLRRLGSGDLTSYRLGTEGWRPFSTRRPPLIDVGFIAHVKAGRVAVVPEVGHFTVDGVRFVDGSEGPYDVVVAATGFTTGLEQLIDAPGILDERGLPLAGTRDDGLFFIGYADSLRGHLLETSRKARRLVKEIDRFLRSTRPSATRSRRTKSQH